MMASSASFCKAFLKLLPGNIFLEEQKEEETICAFCSKSPATLLYSGLPACFSCYQLQKSEKNLKFHHLSKKSLGSPTRHSLSPHKLTNHDIKSLKTFNFGDKSGGVASQIPRIKTLEKISKGRILKDQTKQKSLFRTGNTQEINNVAFSKNVLKDFIEKISKKGIDFSSAIFQATEGSFSSKAFHETCDNQENLVVIIVFSSGYILGTFQEIPMTSEQNVISDEKATIFSLFGGEKAFYYEISSHKLKYEPSGLCFGVPTGLLLNWDILDESFCGLELKYKSPLGGDVKFKIAENFVWSLIIKEVLAFKLS